MIRKNRPYLFYDTTSSVCTTCLRVVEAKILVKDDHVFMDKWCPAHGTERVLVADDASYYRLCREVYIKPPEMPQQFNTKMQSLSDDLKARRAVIVYLRHSRRGGAFLDEEELMQQLPLRRAARFDDGAVYVWQRRDR